MLTSVFYDGPVSHTNLVHITRSIYTIMLVFQTLEKISYQKGRKIERNGNQQNINEFDSCVL